jgi:hypothetical protein
MPSWGITPHHVWALRRCAAYVATTPLLRQPPASGWPTHSHRSSQDYYFARRAYTLDNPTAPMGARKQAHIRLCGVLVKRDSLFRRKCSCRSIPHRHSTQELSPKVVIITSHTPQSLLNVGTVGLPIAYALRATTPLLFTLCHSPCGRHEFVGNRAESEARAVCPDSTPFGRVCRR